MIEVRPTAETVRTMALAKEWPKRARAVMRVLAYVAAREAHEELLQRLPSGAAWDSYRKALKVGPISGSPGSYLLYADPTRRRVASFEARKTLLYVRARPVGPQRASAAAVLEKYSPWTPETLPFTPKRSEASVVARRTTPDEVQRVVRARRADRYKWRNELARLGVRVPASSEGLEVPKSVHAVPDLMYEALRLEFGLDGTQARPHWRPGLTAVMRRVRNYPTRHPKLVRAMTALDFKDWQRWPPPSGRAVSPAKARMFAAFQRKLGLRVY